MKTSTFSQIIISLFITAAVFTGNLHAADLMDYSSNVFKFQQKLAKKGNVYAQFKLASMYEVGDGVSADIEQAKHWYARASAAGSQSAAQRNTYLDIKQNGFDAARDTVWLNSVKADASMRKADAVFLLGQLYHEGIGVKKDLRKSLDFYKEIKSLGDTNVGKEIALINQELEADEIAAQKREKRRAAQHKRTQQAELEEELAKQAETVQVQAAAIEKEIIQAEQLAAEEQLAKAEKRRKYEAVMLQIKLEQQQIEELQSQVGGSEMASLEDEF